MNDLCGCIGIHGQSYVNEAEYRGLLLGFDLLSKLDRGRIVICGDSNLIIRQMRCEINCKAPGLQLLRQKAMDHLRSWSEHEFLHMKRDWNQSADRSASIDLQNGKGTAVTSEEERQGLMALNRLVKLLKPKPEDAVVRVAAVTRSAIRRRRQPEVLQEEIVQRMRRERILQAQGEEKWIADLKKYLEGDVTDLTLEEAKACRLIAGEYELGESGLLFYCSASRQNAGDDLIVRLVVLETLQQDFLHHYHASMKGGHQGIGKTYQRIRAHFLWRGLFRSVQRYVGECVDCETGKGQLLIQGESPGNVCPTYSFQVITMDHIPSLLKSFKGNTELLIWCDLFTGYVIASSPRVAQTVAENYEERLFRRFGASEGIRHDREPGFTADFFRAFSG